MLSCLAARPGPPPDVLDQETILMHIRHQDRRLAACQLAIHERSNTFLELQDQCDDMLEEMEDLREQMKKQKVMTISTFTLWLRVWHYSSIIQIVFFSGRSKRFCG